jgi:hypothetical protein
MRISRLTVRNFGSIKVLRLDINETTVLYGLCAMRIVRSLPKLEIDP